MTVSYSKRRKINHFMIGRKSLVVSSLVLIGASKGESLVWFKKNIKEKASTSKNSNGRFLRRTHLIL